jgi:hypothetical protein
MQLEFDFNPEGVHGGQHPFMADAWVVNVGGWRNVVVYGAGSFPPLDVSCGALLSFEMPMGHPWLNQMRSEAWSANCSHFLLFQEGCAVLFPVHGGEAVADPCRSFEFLRTCIDGLVAGEAASFGKRPRKGSAGIVAP